MYTIVDIETTGNGIKGNKITEISIFKYDGYEVIDEFTSLVNPECEIPFFITGLTGIDNALVRDAPKLMEITDRILEITKDTIFVAHSVGFDYNVIKNEFKTLGLEFTRKKLCTVRLSRKLIPGYNSYSLGKLCSALEIPLIDRHRARGDAQATTLLFQKLLRTDGAETVFKTFLNARSQEITLPAALPKQVYDDLPNAPGIYYFKNVKGKIIYVGKAINIKKRVLSHFYDKATKEIQMCQQTADIDFELSGNELVALLMESAAIKHHYPEYNRSQKRNIQRYGIFTYEDRNGILHLAFNKIKMVPNPLAIFYNTTDCRLYLEEICKTFSLCAKYCHLQENVDSCSHYRIKKCEGICRGEETLESYNEKVGQAIDFMNDNNQDLLIQEKGRTFTESAFILIKNGIYVGYGFMEKEIQINTFEDLEAFMIPQKSTLETERIIKSFVTRNPHKLLKHL
ncbi:MAG: exonuclease domain-containing protein, partial [Maribacter sp.]